jgi:hypothetical protein
MAIDARLATTQHPAIAESLMSGEVEFLSRELSFEITISQNFHNAQSIAQTTREETCMNGNELDE